MEVQKYYISNAVMQSKYVMEYCLSRIATYMYVVTIYTVV